MPIDGVNKVSTDGRYKLPPKLAEKYEGSYFVADDRDGQILLREVNKDRECNDG